MPTCELAGPLEQLATSGTGPGSCRCAPTTASSESSHSWVSPGSVSGSWWTKPSMIMALHRLASGGPRCATHPPSDVIAHDADRPCAYTDGACSGNPGPGGWAWAVPGGALRVAGPTAAHHQPAHGDHGRLRGGAGHRRAARDRQRLDLRRELLPRPLVGGLAEAGLEEHAREAGGQPGPVGAVHRARPRPGRRRRSAGSRATPATR